MVEASQRAAYLRALGIDQWQPRAQPLAATPEPIEIPVSVTEDPMPAQKLAPVQPIESAVVEAVEVFAALREHLQDERAHALLEQAAINWSNPIQAEPSLAVLGIDACGSLLSDTGFEQDQATLHKMLSAIGCDLNQSAQGGLHWQSPSSDFLAPNVLLLVDSGEDQAALIQHWRDKSLQIQGAALVIAPHPRMFSQGTSIKRQAWNSLQLLQKNWVA